MKAIEAQDVTMRYPGSETAAIDGVGFDVERGEIFGFLGRNGAGKSTMVRILTTLLTPTEGGARVVGLDVVADRAELRGRLGVTLQEAALDDLMTGREHLVLTGRLGGLGKTQARGRASELLEAFGLAAAAGRTAGAYSGGMRRRLAIALALVREPEVLFLDEPTTGLDPQSRRALWQLIRRLRDQGATVFLTTQYLEEADELADRIAVLHEGRVTATGTPAALKDRLGATSVHLRIAGGDGEAVLRAAPGAGRLRRDDQGWIVTLEGGESAVPAMLAHLHGEGASIERLAIAPPSLEQVFVNLTGAEIETGEGSDAAAAIARARRAQGRVAGSGEAR